VLRGARADVTEFSYMTLMDTSVVKHNMLKLGASSMLHEAKIEYYAFDVIRFFVPYAARLKMRGARTLFTRRQAVTIET
jgi:hypothetical protein